MIIGVFFVYKSIGFHDFLKLHTLRNGKVLFKGAGSDMLTKQSLFALYDCEIELVEHKEQQIVLNFKSEIY